MVLSCLIASRSRPSHRVYKCSPQKCLFNGDNPDQPVSGIGGTIVSGKPRAMVRTRGKPFEPKLRCTSRFMAALVWQSLCRSKSCDSSGAIETDQDTLWLFNIAIENDPCIDDFPIKTTIYRGFSMAMLNNQMVDVLFPSVG